MMNGIEYAGSGGGGSGGGNVDDVYVNGTSVLDSDKIAQITSYEEVTYAEWVALPDTKYTNGIAYFIKDSTEAEGFPPLIYSDEEREVGVWRDGKPLYQKTLNGTFPSNTTTNEFNIPNIETLIDAAGFVLNTPNIQHFPATYTSSAFINVIYNGTTQRINVNRASSSNWSGKAFYVTIWYTKTTDTAGSGIWAGNGAMAHHYSSSETIIGTWTDGKPLYEKVVTFTASQAGYVDVSDLHISKMISCAGFVTQTNGNIVNLPYGAGNNDFAIPYYNTTNGRLYCSYSGSYNVAEWTVILQYTKTTD